MSSRARTEIHPEDVQRLLDRLFDECRDDRFANRRRLLMLKSSNFQMERCIRAMQSYLGSFREFSMEVENHAIALQESPQQALQIGKSLQQNVRLLTDRGRASGDDNVDPTSRSFVLPSKVASTLLRNPSRVTIWDVCSGSADHIHPQFLRRLQTQLQSFATLLAALRENVFTELAFADKQSRRSALLTSLTEQIDRLISDVSVVAPLVHSSTPGSQDEILATDLSQMKMPARVQVLESRVALLQLRIQALEAERQYWKDMNDVSFNSKSTVQVASSTELRNFIQSLVSAFRNFDAAPDGDSLKEFLTHCRKTIPFMEQHLEESSQSLSSRDVSKELDRLKVLFEQERDALLEKQYAVEKQISEKTALSAAASVSASTSRSTNRQEPFAPSTPSRPLPERSRTQRKPWQD
eukprot:ANDGO_02899.mRNA.1 hypothetical protein